MTISLTDPFLVNFASDCELGDPVPPGFNFRFCQFYLASWSAQRFNGVLGEQLEVEQIVGRTPVASRSRDWAQGICSDRSVFRSGPLPDTGIKLGYDFVYQP